MNGNRSMVWEQLRFGAWNIRTMRGRERELVEEMKKYRLEMLGVSETKARGNGEKAIGDVSCVFSGVQAGRARAGVAVLLFDRLGRCLKEWKCVNERILRIRLKVEGMWLTVIQVYAPTDDSNREVKAEFFARESFHENTQMSHKQRQFQLIDAYLMTMLAMYTCATFCALVVGPVCRELNIHICSVCRGRTQPS